jgi:Ricin-type beta-trefoil lectin domain-like
MRRTLPVRPDGTIRALGKCLDAARGGTSNGTVIDLYDCNGTAAQAFKLTPQP